MNNNGNYYSILGLPVTASIEDIHKAYRELAKETHPDIKGKALHDKMVLLNNAYRVLKDPLTREEYNFMELLQLKTMPVEVQEKLPQKIPDRKNRPLIQTVMKKITGKATLYTMTAVAIRFRTAMMYAASPKPYHQEMAITELKKALELEPKHVDSLYNLGLIYCRVGELINGIYYMKKYLELEKDEKVSGVVAFVEKKLANVMENTYQTKRLNGFKKYVS